MSSEQLESRSLSMFLSAIHTDSTKKQYMRFLNHYLIYTQKNNYDELITDSLDVIQTNLEDFLLDLKETHSRSYINSQFNALILFFKMNSVNINDFKIRKMFPAQEDKVGGIAYSKDEIKKILDSIPTPKRERKRKELRNKALVYFFASSGCRVGGVACVRWCDVKPIEDCLSILVHAETRSQYTTFLTPQARKALFEYRDFILENKQEDQEIYQDSCIFAKDVFRKSDIYKNEDTLRRVAERLLVRANISHKTSNGRYTVPVLHGFRKFFNTTLKANKEINPLFVELMLGHTPIKLDSHYLKPSTEKLFEEYKKGISDLTI